MPYAISLLLDETSTHVIRQHWSALANAGLSRSMLDLGYPPHLTLCVYEQLDVDAATKGLIDAVRTIERIAVSFPRVATFQGESGVLYAAPSDATELLTVHAAVTRAINQPSRAHYEAGHWVPHCTLATGMSAQRLLRGKALIEQHWREVRGRFEAIELVRFDPIESIWRSLL